MPEQTELDPAQLLKKVLAEAQFSNTDIGGTVFSLLDSLSYDFTANGWEWSDASSDLMQEVINILAQDYDDIRTDDVEEEEDEDLPEVLAENIKTAEVEEEEDEPDIAMVPVSEEVVEEIDDVEELDISDLEVSNDGQGSENVPTAG